MHFNYITIKNNIINYREYGNKKLIRINENMDIENVLKKGINLDFNLKTPIIELDDSLNAIKIKDENKDFVYVKLKNNNHYLINNLIKRNKNIDRKYYYIKENNEFRIYIKTLSRYSKGILMEKPIKIIYNDLRDYMI